MLLFPALCLSFSFSVLASDQCEYFPDSWGCVIEKTLFMEKDKALIRRNPKDLEVDVASVKNFIKTTKGDFKLDSGSNKKMLLSIAISGNCSALKDKDTKKLCDFLKPSLKDKNCPSTTAKSRQSDQTLCEWIRRRISRKTLAETLAQSSFSDFYEGAIHAAAYAENRNREAQTQNQTAVPEPCTRPPFESMKQTIRDASKALVDQ